MERRLNGCYQKAQGQLRVIDAEAGDTCRASEVAIAWNARGPAGAQGPTGDNRVAGEVDPRSPSDAFSRFHDGETTITDAGLPGLLELGVPVGEYATTGTVVVSNKGPTSVIVHC